MRKKAFEEVKAVGEVGEEESGDKKERLVINGGDY